MIGDLFDSPWKILIVAVVVIVLFGTAKLPLAARSLGKSMRILKAEVKDFHDEEPEAESAAPAAVPAPVSAAAPVSAPTPVSAPAPAPAQQRIDELERQLAELKEPAVQRTGQPG